MSQLRVAELGEFPAFASLANDLWSGRVPEDLGVLMTPMEIGYFAFQGIPNLAREETTPPRSVLMVSDHNLSKMLAVPARREHIEELGYGWTYQNELLAKGIGVLGANTPSAHVRREFARKRAVIRDIPVMQSRGWSDIYVGRGSDTLSSRTLRFLQHGLGYAGALARDVIHQKFAEPGDYSLPGTDRAVKRRADLYGGAVCALIPMSPSYYHYQKSQHVDQRGIAPGHVLANGVSNTGPLFLRGVIGCEIPLPELSRKLE